MRVFRATPPRVARRGVAAAEFAIILPVLVLVVLGCVDFGRFAYNYIALANAARAGAAYGSMNNYTTSTQATWQAGVVQAAKDEMTQQVGSGNIGSLSVTSSVTTDTYGKRVKVTVTYPFTTVVKWNWTGLSLPSSLTLTQQAELPFVR